MAMPVEHNKLSSIVEIISEKGFEGMSEAMQTVFNFPAEHRRRLRTSNIAERVNQEIRRRTRVVRIFPNINACERLVGAILMEISENWLSAQVYLTV